MTPLSSKLRRQTPSSASYARSYELLTFPSVKIPTITVFSGDFPDISFIILAMEAASMEPCDATQRLQQSQQNQNICIDYPTPSQIRLCNWRIYPLALICFNFAVSNWMFFFVSGDKPSGTAISPKNGMSAISSKSKSAAKCIWPFNKLTIQSAP